MRGWWSAPWGACAARTLATPVSYPLFMGCTGGTQSPPQGPRPRVEGPRVSGLHRNPLSLHVSGHANQTMAQCLVGFNATPLAGAPRPSAGRCGRAGSPRSLRPSRHASSPSHPSIPGTRRWSSTPAFGAFFFFSFFGYGFTGVGARCSRLVRVVVGTDGGLTATRAPVTRVLCRDSVTSDKAGAVASALPWNDCVSAEAAAMVSPARICLLCHSVPQRGARQLLMGEEQLLGWHTIDT